MPVAREFPWYPLLIVAAVVLSLWSGQDIRFVSVIRPLVIATIAVGVLLFVSIRMLGHDLGGLVGGAAVLVGLSNSVERGGFFFAAAALAILVTALAARMARRPMLRSITSVANTFTGILLVLVVGTSLLNGSALRAAGELARSLPDLGRGVEASSSGPNLYLLMLDGYPRADTLERLFGFDNQPFLDNLEAKGFEVSPRSRSSYMYTSLTLGSMFGLAHIDGPVRRADLNQSAGLRLLGEHGYRVATVATPWEDVRIDDVDEVCGDGRISEIEIMLIQSSVLRPVIDVVDPDFEARSRRDYVNGAFDCLQGFTGSDTAQFTFIHIPSPHWPMVFRRDGSPADRRAFVSSQHAANRGEAYVEQIEYINSRVLEAVQRIVEADPGGAVVVFSDHGSEFGLVRDSLAQTDVDERTSNFFAARTPGHPCLFGSGPTTVNLLARLVRAYLEAPVELLSDDLFLSTMERPFEISRRDNPDATATCLGG